MIWQQNWKNDFIFFRINLMLLLCPEEIVIQKSIFNLLFVTVENFDLDIDWYEATLSLTCIKNMWFCPKLGGGLTAGRGWFP